MSCVEIENYPFLLSEIYDYLNSCLQNHDIDEASSKKISFDAIEKLRANFGGNIIYIPKGLSIERKAKNHAIMQDFKGNNHYELAKKYNLSVQRIYTIIKQLSHIDQDLKNE